MTGGFTREGAVDEVAGVVHAGEWVASQKLVRDPRTRPILEALDYAQRTNTIGSLSAEDVSSTITAPAVLAKSSLASQSIPQRVVVENNVDSSSVVTSSLERYADTIDRLNKRLDEPFFTVNSVTGENGMQKAQEELVENAEHGGKPDLEAHFHFLNGKYSFVCELAPMKAYSTLKPSLLRLYAIRLEENCFLIVYGGIKLADTIQNSPDLKDNVIQKLDKVLAFLKREGITERDDI